MGQYRAVHVAAVLAMLCGLLSSVPAVHSQTCATLLGDDTVAADPTVLGSGPTAVFAFGAFTALDTIPAYSSTRFVFPIPDQTSATTPNELKFAVYTTTSSPSLVAESDVAIIQAVSGPQQLVAYALTGATPLAAGDQYLLAVVNQHDFNYYSTQLAQSNYVVSPYDFQQHFPGSLATGPTGSNLLLPVEYQGCSSTFTPGQCHPETPVLGDNDMSHYTPSGFLSGGNAAIIGVFTTPCDLYHYISNVFTLTVPDQRTVVNGQQGFTPNMLRLAVYTADLQTLVAQSGPLLLTSAQGPDMPDVVFDAVPVDGIAVPLLPSTSYVLVLATQNDVVLYSNEAGSVYTLIDPSTAATDPNGFPGPLPTGIATTSRNLFPLSYDGCCEAGRGHGSCHSTTCPGTGDGDPVFVGFHGQRFDVHGHAGRVYNVLSLPTLQLNTRFVPLSAGAALNASAQSLARTRQSRLISLLTGQKAGTAGTVDTLPSTTSWSHDGLYMGETAVQVDGHRVKVQPGAYLDGFTLVELDGVPVHVSSERVQLSAGSSIRRSSSSVLHITTADVSFTLVNSDHFLNIHDAELTTPVSDPQHVHGLLGQTADRQWTVSHTAAFKQRIEADFMAPKGQDVWSTSFPHNRYVPVSAAQ